jgi:hypothetical protein
MITATPPWEADDEPGDFNPCCPDDIMLDREKERLDQELQYRWWKYYQYEED